MPVGSITSLKRPVDPRPTGAMVNMGVFEYVLGIIDSNEAVLEKRIVSENC
jgi:hypothetical protein